MLFKAKTPKMAEGVSTYQPERTVYTAKRLFSLQTQMEDKMGILSWIIVGLIAGWLAGLVMRGDGFGLLGNIVVGVIGGLLGGWLGTAVFGLGADVSGINIESIFVAFVGAVILLLLVRLLRGGRRIAP